MPIEYNLYPPNWKTEIVPQVLARAGYKCEYCQRSQGQQVISYQVAKIRKGKRVYRKEWHDLSEWNEGGKLVTIILTIAHLDNDHYNWKVSIERLRALCQMCHLRLDAQYKADKRRAQIRAAGENQLKIF